MTLPVDTSRALRTLADQRTLIEALVGAPASEQETDWLEWKSDVDLKTKEWRATTARHILGFANRHPDLAAQVCEGCAYLVLGAGPMNLRGSRVYDVAQINAWLSAYVGATQDSPQWSATYADVGDARVLLITVERPRWGDPIWTFRKEYTPPPPGLPMRAGTIYVRHKGSTEQADPGEVRMLTLRAGTGPRRLSVTLRLEDGETAVPVDLGEESMNGWLAAERAALTVRTAKQQSRRPNRSSKPESVGAERLISVRDVLSSSSTFGETRTLEQFNAEVDEYLAKAAKAIPAALKRGAIRHKLGRVHFWVDNETEHNFSQVVVEVGFDQPTVKAYFEEADVEGPELPRRPDQWGSYNIGRLFRSLPVISTSSLYPGSGATRGPRGTIDNSGSTSIRFAPIDLRPGYSNRLETVYIAAGPEHAGRSIPGSWLATAADVSGMVRGSVEVPVAASVPGLEELLTQPVRDDD